MRVDRQRVLNLWQRCQVTSSLKAMFEHQAHMALGYKGAFYDPVSQATGIPWYVVAAIDMREESFNHNGYLGNGDPLWEKTTHVPRGRGPFKTWYEGAIDALKFDHMAPAKGEGEHWDIVTALIALEAYNGLGYEGRENSPYIWAGTNQQQHGKFSSDGHFDPNDWDTQPGCAGLLFTLKEKHGVDLSEA